MATWPLVTSPQRLNQMVEGTLRHYVSLLQVEVNDLIEFREFGSNRKAIFLVTFIDIVRGTDTVVASLKLQEWLSPDTIGDE